MTVKKLFGVIPYEDSPLDKTHLIETMITVAAILILAVYYVGADYEAFKKCELTYYGETPLNLSSPNYTNFLQNCTIVCDRYSLSS
jgi:hypothetical protein